MRASKPGLSRSSIEGKRLVRMGHDFMSMTCSVAGMLSVGLTILSAELCGQDYPSQPIRMIGSSPGGGNDLVMRLIAPTLKTSLGQPVVIDNRPSLLIGEIGFKAPPDGYTLIVVGNSFITANLLRDTPWDPVRDFSPVTLADAGPSVPSVHPSVPAWPHQDQYNMRRNATFCVPSNGTLLALGYNQ